MMLLLLLCCSPTDHCPSSPFGSQPSSRLQVRKSKLGSLILFKFPALNLSFLALSPIKTANFESHYINLQTDSNYLLSDEYEVSCRDPLALAHLSPWKRDSSTSVTAYLAVRTSKRSDETSPRTQLWCPRTAARTDTTTSSPVSPERSQKKKPETSSKPESTGLQPARGRLRSHMPVCRVQMTRRG